MRSGKESGLSPSFSSGNSDVPSQNLAGRHLSLRNYDAQVGEAMAMAMVKALNRMTLLAMLTSVRLV